MDAGHHILGLGAAVQRTVQFEESDNTADKSIARDVSLIYKYRQTGISLSFVFHLAHPEYPLIPILSPADSEAAHHMVYCPFPRDWPPPRKSNDTIHIAELDTLNGQSEVVIHQHQHETVVCDYLHHEEEMDGRIFVPAVIWRAIVADLRRVQNDIVPDNAHQLLQQLCLAEQRHEQPHQLTPLQKSLFGQRRNS